MLAVFMLLALSLLNADVFSTPKAPDAIKNIVLKEPASSVGKIRIVYAGEDLPGEVKKKLEAVIAQAGLEIARREGEAVDAVINVFGTRSSVSSHSRVIEETPLWVKTEYFEAARIDCLVRFLKSMDGQTFQTIFMWRIKGEQQIQEVSPGRGKITQSEVDNLLASRDFGNLAMMLEAYFKQDAKILDRVFKQASMYACCLIAEFLGEVGNPAAVAPLIAVLSAPDYDLRVAAVVALGKLRDVRAIGPLIEMLDDSVQSVREHAHEALLVFGASAVEPLTAKVAGGGNTRLAAVELLTEIKDPSCLDPLVMALTDEVYDVRWRAARALGNLSDGRAMIPLIDAALFGGMVFKEAIQAIGQLRSSGIAVPPEYESKLQEVARRLLPNLGSTYRDAQDEGGELLACIGAAAVEPLIAALKEPGGVNTTGYLMREHAADTLGDIKDMRAVEPLIETLKDSEKFVRISVSEALTKITSQYFGESQGDWRRWWKAYKKASGRR